MELKNIYGSVIFAIEDAKTIFDLVSAARADGQSLSWADLREANLRGADLREANLSGADLRRAHLYGANLSGADLRGANLSEANLRVAHLYGANLSGANLREADLRGANLSGADLRGANLSGADLGGVNLSGAHLGGVNLSGAKNAALVIARLQFIPTEGAFIGWKKCRDGLIVKLEIQADAKRSHGSERKCRCSKAFVLAIYRAYGVETDFAKSEYDNTFIYRVGQMVEPTKGFDEDRWNTCGAGIHFYITKEEAEAHV